MTGFGIVIIATGHKGFGTLASNLGVSVRALMPDVPMCLIHDEGIRVPAMFTDAVKVPIGSNAFQIKTQLYDLTPYKRTLYIDADSLVIRDMRPEIEAMQGSPVQFMEYRRYKKGDTGRMVWANIATLWDFYQLPDNCIMPEYNSSIFYFEKGRESKRFFSEAQKAYGTKVRLKEYVRRQFPDEVAFSVASCKTGTLSPKAGWQPAYLEWPTAHGLSVKGIRASYGLVTMSGKSIPSGNTKMVYNGLGSQFAKQTGLHFELWLKALKPS